ncbi:hypothetical protein HNQ94_000689 [Salirhabdus euzebyi]|uniref:DUF2515 domain-containing protein n=1 Tax=Salirhabdus euzebyi TaxID=394506 RepID=A0A841PWJ8_9BACI|nr:DUF2515 family protein [Salirhabdus euzebyi]MBB6452244.1 hypothetical protein [Salirhabdus euzebyi]
MEDQLIKKIQESTQLHNKNNITRTKAYLHYYQNQQEIEWAFLASMVSRNAGWNMTDLKTHTYRQLLSKKMARFLYMTYERANWFIFADAFPQLLIYKHSVLENRPLFHLLKAFHVSTFMMKEWSHFWIYQDKKRLVKAQIINEQNLIEKPVVQQPFFKWKVFHSLPYFMQDRIHLNSVLFPTPSGKLYGLFIKKFTDVHQRIKIGKRLASILFSPRLYEGFYTFAQEVEPTGKRQEYERKLHGTFISSDSLEDLFPTIRQENNVHEDWSVWKTVSKEDWKEEIVQPKEIGELFYKKRGLIRKVANKKETFFKPLSK